MSGNERDGLTRRVERLEVQYQQFRADVAQAMSKLVSMIRAQDERVGNLRQLAQAQQIALEAVARDPRRGVEAATGFLDAQGVRWASKLAVMIENHFNLNEMQSDLCYELDLRWENLSGDTRRKKAQYIADHFRRRKTLDFLAKACQELRPQVQWPLSAVDVDIL